MVNSLVEVIESTRSKHTPKIGDRVVYTQKGGEYHPYGLIEKKHEDKFYVCLDPFIPFVWESDNAIKVDVSGGPFYHADADKFKFIGWAEADFKEQGHCGATANGTGRFKAKVPLWAYSEPDPLYGDFTTKDWKKITLRKRKEGNLYDSTRQQTVMSASLLMMQSCSTDRIGNLLSRVAAFITFLMTFCF